MTSRHLLQLWHPQQVTGIVPLHISSDWVWTTLICSPRPWWPVSESWEAKYAAAACSLHLNCRDGADVTASAAALRHRARTGSPSSASEVQLILSEKKVSWWWCYNVHDTMRRNESAHNGAMRKKRNFIPAQVKAWPMRNSPILPLYLMVPPVFLLYWCLMHFDAIKSLKTKRNSTVLKNCCQTCDSLVLGCNCQHSLTTQLEKSMAGNSLKHVSEPDCNSFVSISAAWMIKLSGIKAHWKYQTFKTKASQNSTTERLFDAQSKRLRNLVALAVSELGIAASPKAVVRMLRAPWSWPTSQKSFSQFEERTNHFKIFQVLQRRPGLRKSSQKKSEK